MKKKTLGKKTPGKKTPGKKTPGKKTPEGKLAKDLNSISGRIRELTMELQRDNQVLTQLNMERERISNNALAKQGAIFELRKFLPIPPSVKGVDPKKLLN